MKPEQRKHFRRSLRAAFGAREPSSSGELSFDSRDLSLGGAFLQSDLLLEQGELIALTFTLPGGLSPIQARARVAWVKRFPAAGEEAGMGVEFVTLSEEDRRAIEDFVAGS